MLVCLDGLVDGFYMDFASNVQMKGDFGNAFYLHKASLGFMGVNILFI